MSIKSMWLQCLLHSLYLGVRRGGGTKNKKKLNYGTRRVLGASPQSRYNPVATPEFSSID